MVHPGIVRWHMLLGGTIVGTEIDLTTPPHKVSVAEIRIAETLSMRQVVCSAKTAAAPLRGTSPLVLVVCSCALSRPMKWR